MSQRSWTLLSLVLMSFVAAANDPYSVAAAATDTTAEGDSSVSRRSREVISTPDAPAAIGPYSQAIRAGKTLYVSGQIALDPRTGQLVSGGVEAETRQVMKNLGAILQAAGSSFDGVVKVTIFAQDVNDYATINKIYAESFSKSAPAREFVQVARIPRDARLEISLIASLE